MIIYSSRDYKEVKVQTYLRHWDEMFMKENTNDFFFVGSERTQVGASF
jgi:hypothetical protein